MEATAKATYVRISPRKVQIVLDLIRNQPTDKAMAILQYTPKAACEPVLKVLKSAIANAENNNNMDTSRLVVSYCNATAGPTMSFVLRSYQSKDALNLFENKAISTPISVVCIVSHVISVEYGSGTLIPSALFPFIT